MQPNKNAIDMTKQAGEVSPQPVLRELSLDELRAVSGGVRGQIARPDPTVYTVYPVVQNNQH